MNRFLFIAAIALYAVLAFLFIGCARKPGQPFPYTTSSTFEDDAIYHGVGIEF